MKAGPTPAGCWNRPEPGAPEIARRPAWDRVRGPPEGTLTIVTTHVLSLEVVEPRLEQAAEESTCLQQAGWFI